VPLIIGDAPKEGRKRVVLPGDGPFAGSFTVKTPRRGSARLLSLDGKWLDCSVVRYGRGLSVVNDDLVRSGMSGSPIVMADQAIGLISTGRLNPVLKDCLPAWFLRPGLVCRSAPAADGAPRCGSVGGGTVDTTA
jgi:hypothetical protein